MIKFLIYLVFINVLAVLNCIIDKENAKIGKKRVSEKRLFLLSLFGGSLAMYFTMRLIRHKTRHKRFMIGLPIIIAAQAVLICIFLNRCY